MKRKAACEVSLKEQPVLYSPMKGIDEINSLDARKTAATALITSSFKKRRAGACLASTTLVLQRSKVTKGSSLHADGVLVMDSCHDLRLAFSSLDGASSDHKGVSTTLDTIFSPVFHLLNGEASNSCTSSVELADSADEKAEDAATRLEGQGDVDSGSDVCEKASTESWWVADACLTPAAEHAGSEGQRDVDSGSYVCNEASGFDICDKASTDSGWVADSCLTPAAEHVDSGSHSTNEEVLGTQGAFDVGANCMEWSLEVESRDPVHAAEHMDNGIFDPEGSSLYLAIQQTKALDGSHETSHAEVTADDGDIDEFDPYLFIKHLPCLSDVGRPPVLLPKQTSHCPPITLVLDLDETLVHSTLEQCGDADFTFPLLFNSLEYTVYVRRRPHLQMFMERVSQMFEIIVFTASQSVYAEQLLNVLDPQKKLIRHRVFRDSCVFVDGNYLKDLSILGRDLSKVAIVDNSPQAFGFQVDNNIPIESWFDDKSDSALMGLLPFLETLVGEDDVRPIIAKKFNLRQKIAAAMDSSSNGVGGGVFERASS